ncbi:hypothetical protein NF700_10895 [Sphingomonadaceae bacterium OTU29MARTA1]|nr:hypothetical protein NF700_10895 [Sphingomonadaceae bacterium OTU29MARTA1]
MRIDQLTPTPTDAAPIEIPAELLDSVSRQQTHLARLVESLRAAGLQEAMIDTSVRSLVDSYAAELTAAIRTMSKAPDHA